MTTDPLVLVPEVDRATERLLDTVSALSGDDAQVPSLLPGWARGHVLTHLARGADAMVNLLTWARTGTPLPAYASTAARDADIQAGADRPLEELVADVRAAAGRLDEAVAAMPARAWSVVVQSNDGAQVPAAALPWRRLREVEVHHVDLAAAYRPENWPEAFVLRLLHEAATDLSGRQDAPAVVLRATDLGCELNFELSVGDRAGAPTVSGPACSVVAWLVGRRNGTGLTITPSQPLPTLPQWM